MIDINTILVILAYILAIIGGLIGEKGRRTIKNVQQGVNQSTQKILEALAQVNTIAQSSNRAFEIVTDIIQKQSFTAEDIETLKLEIEKIKRAGGIIVSVITEFWASLKDLLGIS